MYCNSLRYVICIYMLDRHLMRSLRRFSGVACSAQNHTYRAQIPHPAHLLVSDFRSRDEAIVVGDLRPPPASHTSTARMSRATPITPESRDVRHPLPRRPHTPSRTTFLDHRSRASLIYDLSVISTRCVCPPMACKLAMTPTTPDMAPNSQAFRSRAHWQMRLLVLLSAESQL